MKAEALSQSARLRTDISALIPKAAEFQAKIEEAKTRVRNRDFEWYPYDSLGNLCHLDAMLTGANRVLLNLTGDEPVLDIGCADGHLAFFLESLGCKVTAVDNEVTNHNTMRGVAALKQVLGSSVNILRMDVDCEFCLPENERYGLALFLGTLYHLKNPFFILDHLSRRAKYCLLSTRVMRRIPQSAANVTEWPIGYILERTELNNDNSNYWIFSEAGLRRLIGRTAWRICDFMTAGDHRTSDPCSLSHDERAFCLLQSHFGLWHIELQRGWHAAEDENWRWTEQRFSAIATRPTGLRPTRLVMKIFLPDVVIDRAKGSITLHATIDGIPIAPASFYISGNHTYARALPQESRDRQTMALDFALDHALSPAEFDGRELGIIVECIEIE